MNLIPIRGRFKYLRPFHARFFLLMKLIICFILVAVFQVNATTMA